jgi:hypothetical protein
LGGLSFDAKPGKKLARLHLSNNNKKLGIVALACRFTHVGDISRRIMIQKRARSTAQVVEYLPLAQDLRLRERERKRD